MAICPSCQAQIEIGSGFYGGLFTCPNCRAVYFIGFDGTPENAQSSAHSGSNQPAAPQPAAPQQQVDYSSQSYSNEPVPEIPLDLPQVPPSYDGPDFRNNPDQNYSPPMDQQINDPMSPMPSYEPMGEVQPNTPTFNPLQDVVDYANSDSSATIATYAVEISGLDSVQSIQAFKEVLSDSKLQMNYDQYKPKIKNGILRIERLTAAQSAVLAFRLRPLPLQMKWEQSLL